MSISFGAYLARQSQYANWPTNELNILNPLHLIKTSIKIYE
jgi:hypothetical protein